ncbi:Na+/H+ antiporter subunit D [Actinorugispora endophytica]|uniref:Multisubunit sodium/proton antiporter MrpD subunit n=1 Tax=Actinorugispora endophytica TaxID=1605990 RepID=A0A4V3D809_9ACTN|nr:Na+/H+ antiporter subunit D [Actinorugispora endophytica]TDQ49977.1 multisubunit sodium/proton antiporter MrpD subunit [Actinorugispora endophytica]
MEAFLHYLVPLPVVLPLFAAGLKFALGVRLQRLSQAVSVVALAAVLVIGLVLLFGVDAYGPQVVQVGGWEAPIGITLVADRLSTLMVTVSSAITLCVLVYSVGQGAADQEEATPLAIFYPTFLILVAGVSNAFLAGDLFNMYVGFEILLTSSYVLLTQGGTAARIRTGSTYVVVSLVSSVIFLVAIGLIYGATGTVNMAQLSVRLGELPVQLQLVLQVMLLLAFAIKAAVFPLSAWLPDSYPTAPAPVTAVFAGLLTKVGVYAMIRTQTLLFDNDALNGVLLWAALATMVIGIFGAMSQNDIKRLLSFTLVSHIGYMVFGIGLASLHGLSGAVFYVAHHITVQTTLFLVTGLIERRGGSTSLNDLSGLAKLSPMLGVLFFLPAMNLAGIPPLSGFLGKLGLLQAGVREGTPLAYLLVAGAVLTSLLTLFSIVRMWNYAFWRDPDDGRPVALGTLLESSEDDSVMGPSSPAGISVVGGTRPPIGIGGKAVMTSDVFPPLMLAATVALVVLGVAYTVFAGPLIGYSEATAAELLARTPYVEAVFPGGVR